jgi:hypothetical protein
LDLAHNRSASPVEVFKRLPSLLVVLAVAVSASSACPAQPAENVAAAPPVVVLRGASAPSEPWTSAPLPVYAEAIETSYLLPTYYYFPAYYFPAHHLVPRHKHAGASHHHK